MRQRFNFYVLALMGVLCLLFITWSRRRDNEDEHFLQSVILREIEGNLNLQRLEIEKEMEGYPYEVLSGRNVSKLSDLVIEAGGTPIRSVILSTWRSGSSLLGDILNFHPASFYEFEPLHIAFDTVRLRSPLSSPEPLLFLEYLFECKFENLGELLEKRRDSIFKSDELRNRYFFHIHRKIGDLYYIPEISKKYCSFFPFQAMKIVSLDLASMEYLLDNKNLGVKLVYLVRDPRGVMNSRKNLYWCEWTSDCFDPARHCSNVLLDFNTAIEFSKKYPDTFKVLRYEDFSRDPEKMSRNIYAFYGLNYHEEVKRFVETHTTESRGDVYSTFRNTSSVVYRWKDQLTFNKTHEIQEHCLEAMRVWGYELAIDGDHQKTFNPIKPLSTKDINYFG